MATILVLVHADEQFWSRHYLIEQLFPYWSAAGHRVLVHEGPATPPPADVAILHVDLSVVPPAYPEALRRYPVVLNARTGDIRKRTISRQLVRRDDGWRGPVVVKTDLNCAGAPEWRLQQMAAAAGVRVARPLRPPTGDYEIFDRVADVPPAVWDDDDLVVERFLAERDERGYYGRFWTFFGDRGYCSRVLGRRPLVKGQDTIERVLVEVPDEIRALRREFGFDYGKFDFTVHDGRPVLLDVNRTPSFPANPNLSGAIRAGLAELAKGIDAFCPD